MCISELRAPLHEPSCRPSVSMPCEVCGGHVVAEAGALQGTAARGCSTPAVRCIHQCPIREARPLPLIPCRFALPTEGPGTPALLTNCEAVILWSVHALQVLSLL